MSTAKRIASGFFWNYIGRTSEYVIIFLFSALIARVLGPEINGIYATLLSIVYFLLIFSSFGLETSIISTFPKLFGENISAASSTFQRLLLIRILISIGIAAVFYFSRSLVIDLLNINTSFYDYLFLILFYFLLRSIISLFNSLLIAFFETRKASTIAVSVRLIELLLGIYILLNGLGLFWIFILITATALLQLGLYLLILNKQLFTKSDSSSKQGIIMLGSKFWLNSILEFLLGKQADIILLGLFLISLYEIGNYDVAFTFSQSINLGLTMGFFGISIAAFSSLDKKDPTVLSKYWESLNRAVILLVIPVFILTLFFAEIIIPFIYKTAYLKSVFWFQLFASVFIITRILGGGIAADYLHSKGDVKSLVISSAVTGILNLTLAIILIPLYGGLGAVFATGIAAISTAVLHILFVKKNIPIRLQFGYSSKILIISLLSGIITFLFNFNLNFWNPIFSVVIYFVILFVIFSFVKPLHPDDTENLNKINFRLYRIAQWFTKMNDRQYQELTDRQKWAFTWLPSSECIIDIGCSMSPLIKFLKEKGQYVVGIDTDLEALESLKTVNPNLNLIQASAENIPLPSNVAETVLLLDVLEHTQDEKMVISEAWRILKPNGLLILSVPHKGLFRFLDPQNVSRRLKKSDESFHRHYSFTDLRRLFFRLFKVEQKHYGGLFIYPLTFAANNFFQKHFKIDLSKFLKKMGDADNDISWGKFSYNLIVKARKI